MTIKFRGPVARLFDKQNYFQSEETSQKKQGEEEGVVSRFLTTILSFHFTLTGNLVYIDCLISISAPDYNQVNI